MVPNLPLAAHLHKAVKRAAYKALRARQEGLTVELKPDGSKVTNGDRLSQVTLLEELWGSKEFMEAVPDVRFIVEESDEETLSELPPDLRDRILTLEEWLASDKKGDAIVVDPVDGTVGYCNMNTRTMNPWGVNCALIRDGRTIACALYEAAIDECMGVTEEYKVRFKQEMAVLHGSLYVAEKGRGAYRLENGEWKKLARQDSRHVRPLYLGRYPGDARTIPAEDNIQFAPEIRNGTEKQPRRNAVIELMEARGHTAIHTMLSTVAAIGEVASGRAEGCSGGGFLWDHYGGDLLLAEAGIPVVVRKAKNSNRTVIIAAHNPAILEVIEDELIQRGVVEDSSLRRENVPDRRGRFAAYSPITQRELHA
jgi:3'-phosphoadenosine 5'-phosphosulfate (PAPS) 3'-phosphatase